MLTRYPSAKLNLGLHVLRRRPDGYHDIDTVLLPIGWHDVLSAERAPNGSVTLSCSDPALPTDGRNLVVRAAHALQAWAADHGGDPWTLGAQLHLEKRIPHGAGLGGGSSDAAQALRLLTALWALDVPPTDFHAIAARLGSDVPFFLYDQPMRATGTGTTLTPLTCEAGTMYACPHAFVVAMPDVQVATAHAYGLITPSDDARADLAAVVCSNDPAHWQEALVNDFEAPILAQTPPIAAAKHRLLDAGAGYAAMTGSGAAVFGVFGDAAMALDAAEVLRAAGCTTWCSANADAGVRHSRQRSTS
ncbi:MAG: 4-(cytidine 5'-diphospho)-2-C-methyl-D-erythritol kinase [Bacteroidota bacterium]